MSQTHKCSVHSEDIKVEAERWNFVLHVNILASNLKKFLEGLVSIEGPDKA